MYNFTLQNEKTLYSSYSMDESYPRDRILDEHTCFTAAKTLVEENKLDIDMDIDSIYDKFRNEVGI